ETINPKIRSDVSATLYTGIAHPHQPAWLRTLEAINFGVVCPCRANERDATMRHIERASHGVARHIDVGGVEIGDGASLLRPRTPARVVFRPDILCADDARATRDQSRLKREKRAVHVSNPGEVIGGGVATGRPRCCSRRREERSAHKRKG